MTGCSAQQGEVAFPEQDIDRWVMPLDRFMAPNDIADNYAETLLMGPCMEAAGFVWDVPWRDTEAAFRETSSLAGVKIFSVAIAQKYGYRSAPSNDPGAAAWTAWAYRDISESEVAAIGTCTDDVRATELPLLSSDAQFSNSLAFAAYDAARQDGAVQDAAKVWRECLARSGVPDLPRAPHEMPTPWLIDKLDLGDPLATPDAEEIRYATADAECRESSGYFATYYRVLWDKQAALVRDNADALLRIEAVVTEHREKVAQVIAEHAPPATG